MVAERAPPALALRVPFFFFMRNRVSGGLQDPAIAGSGRSLGQPARLLNHSLRFICTCVGFAKAPSGAIRPNRTGASDIPFAAGRQGATFMP